MSFMSESNQNESSNSVDCAKIFVNVLQYLAKNLAGIILKEVSFFLCLLLCEKQLIAFLKYWAVELGKVAVSETTISEQEYEFHEGRSACFRPVWFLVPHILLLFITSQCYSAHGKQLVNASNILRIFVLPTSFLHSLCYETSR